MEDFYLVFGLGKSGIAAAELLVKKGLPLAMYDGKPMDEAAVRKNHPSLEGVPMYFERIPEDILEKTTIAVLSPGVPLDIPDVELLRKSGVRLSGEVELAYSLGKGHVAAITGTNGKTTTTSIVGAMFKDYFSDGRIVGNIGIPYTQEADTTTVDTRIAAEISSFQLETIDTFHPQVSAILNITPDHLNRHHTMENYIRAKEAIVRNQTKKDTVVLNYEDDELRHFGSLMVAKVVFFSSARELEEGFYLRDDAIWQKKDGVEEEIIKTDDLNLLGTHNFENVMAAVAIGQAMGVPMDSMRSTLRRFTAVEHRIEYVCEKRGVAFYNDSKGTNPDAAIKAVLAMNRPIVLIGGGFDKASTYDEWVESFEGRVKKLVLIGQTAQDIAECCKKHGFTSYEMASSLENAVLVARGAARPGDCILLSPACASWDMFPNYEVRGNEFKSLAKGLPD